MRHDKPEILNKKQKGKLTAFTLFISNKLSVFEGHFPDQPILPGVSQIDWAIYYAKTECNIPFVFGGMQNIKFQEPIFPNSHVLLELRWEESKQTLYFSYKSITGKPHSSGCINLEPL